MKTRFFCLTTRGLEAISAQEVVRLPGATVENVGYRRVAGGYQGWMGDLLKLRTVDDVFIDLAKWKGIGRARATLEALRQNSGELDLRAAVKTCSQLREVNPQLGFAVTASFVGKRNYSTAEIKKAIAEGIKGRYGWQYLPNEQETDLNLRVFIEHETAYVGLRLGARPLHERGYKITQQPGSLKPPVAAAMLTLTQEAPGQKLLDPCCGAGTILIEAASQGWAAAGGDLDPTALQAARCNVLAAELHIELAQWDAGNLPLASASTGRVACNLPWGRQVGAGPGLEKFYAQVCAELRRVLAPGGLLVLLTNTPEWLRLEDLSLDQQFDISLFGQTPTISVFSAPG